MLAGFVLDILFFFGAFYGYSQLATYYLAECGFQRDPHLQEEFTKYQIFFTAAPLNRII